MVSAQTIVLALEENQLGCSTPYGINGFGTGNFSKQRSKILLCSTPYGINGFGTRPVIPSLLTGGACSTPYGINGFGTACNCALVNFCVVCSTPYGINGFGTITTSGIQFDLDTKCAQRLTASMVSARYLCVMRGKL